MAGGKCELRSVFPGTRLLEARHIRIRTLARDTYTHIHTHTCNTHTHTHTHTHTQWSTYGVEGLEPGQGVQAAAATEGHEAVEDLEEAVVRIVWLQYGMNKRTPTNEDERWVSNNIGTDLVADDAVMVDHGFLQARAHECS